MNPNVIDKEREKELLINKISNRSKEKESTINKIESLLKEYEVQIIKNEEIELKKENITNELKSTMTLVNEKPKNKLNGIINSLDNWINSTQMEMEITKEAINSLEEISEKRRNNIGEKRHIYRESLLSTLFLSDKNLKSIYYLTLTLFTWFFFWVLLNDYSKTGKFFDVEFLYSNFNGLSNVIIFWFLMFFYNLLIIPYVKFIEFYAKKNKRINFIFYFIYITYQVLFYWIMIYFVFSFSRKISIVCGFITGCETTRFSLKVHGYFREKILYGLKEFHIEYTNFSFKRNASISNNDNNNNNNNVNNTNNIDNKYIVDIKIHDIKTEFKKFLYFFFCPSLIYRDEYPRLSYHRKHYILAHCINFICCIMLYYVLFRYVIFPYFNYSTIIDYYNIHYFIFDVLRLAVPGVCVLVVGFFLILHSWLNLWSELMLHGDRRFYEDWWTCTNFEEYYRKWNMVVHEWLFSYIYSDAIRFTLGRLNRHHAKFLVFGLSVIVHDIIIWIALGFFFPILAFFFGGPGIIFTYIKPKSQIFNILFWTKLFLGKGLLTVFYLREFNMRSFFRENITLVDPWHEFYPRTILMFMEPYKQIIFQHFNVNA
jgi:sterol O-acyltransferase